MGEIVNLNKARKKRAKAAGTAQAAANRVKHGRTPAERANDARAEARRQALLDGARADPGDAGAAAARDPGPGQTGTEPSRAPS